jgi:O-antigen/teichoic acid export membrane protein
VSDTFYIAAAWIATFVAVGLYSLWVVRRGRKLSEVVPPDERRWL